MKDLKIPNNNSVGRVTKKRFVDRLGNDQLWEGKGEERAYNTDFVGIWDPVEKPEPTTNTSVTPNFEITETKSGEILLTNLEDINQTKMCPYEKETETETPGWYSDHGFVIGKFVKIIKEYDRKIYVCRNVILGRTRRTPPPENGRLRLQATHCLRRRRRRRWAWHYS